MNKPYKIYGQEFIDPNALAQFFSAMEMSWAIQGAVLPDSHYGYSLPIGSVVATKGMLVPAWVGYDEGCGVCAVKTDFNIADIVEFQKEIFELIYQLVPVGRNHNKESVLWEGLDMLPHSPWLEEMYKNTGGARQLGTLGGGNHFIEICFDSDNMVWIIVHSGSRNVGHRTATNYMKLASGTNKAKEGHYPIPADSEEGEMFFADLNFCLSFALKNREVIIERVMDAIFKVTSKTGKWLKIDEGNPTVKQNHMINRNHNHAEFNESMGMWIHRKGATHAAKGMLGVIPGNMRDGSFIVRGKGCEASLFSSSHGAGRTMSRRKAQETFKVEDFHDAMYGITAKVGASTLDESPFAYKDISQVMHGQSDLVEIITKVVPIINIKG